MNKKGQKLYVAFVDFEKAFDFVHHDKPLLAMQEEGVPRREIILTVKFMYDSLLSCVNANNDYSDLFWSKKKKKKCCPVGVRQGCVLSLTIFSVH